MRLTPAKRLRPASVSEVLQPGEEVTSVSNAEQNFTSISQISETQQVGTRAWTVEYREDVHQKLEELSSRFGKLEADLSALKKTLAPSHIRNLAAQVLLHAVAPLELSETDHRVQDLAKQHYQPLLDFAEQLAVRPALLAARADAGTRLFSAGTRLFIATCFRQKLRLRRGSWTVSQTCARTISTRPKSCRTTTCYRTASSAFI